MVPAPGAVRILLPVICASVALAGCASNPGSEWLAWPACIVGDRVADPIDLAGEYEILLYATSGPEVGGTTAGRMTLMPQAGTLLAVPDVDGTPLPGVSMPLYGSAETHYAVCTENGAEERPFEGLLEGSPRD